MKKGNDMEKLNIFGFLTQICITYTVSMASMSVLALLVGEGAKDFGTMFALGSAGVSVSVMQQFFVVSVLISVIRELLFSERIFKNMPALLRDGLMILSIGILMVAAIFCFNWFPVHMWQPWVSFLICYIICVSISLALVIIKNKIENKNYGEALKLYLEEQEKLKK